ncbi:MAG: murein biosynthesis integral membrane protein MurJ [Omnitrophica WOR_2 bacterium RIFCSPHIGHO2_02_FULL_68_15]|nr:MAG: murein biosynthesis integral membrane protein MurJ [Omnitrophica WOR_2 bacterium RIFCSPHIGHO2_02_FULL_68_15]
MNSLSTSSHDSHRETVRSAGAIGLATLMSRVLGFVRDVLVARLFGTSAPAQAFAVAFRLPNMLRDLVGEGAANAAFVPVLTEQRRRRPQEFWAAAGALFNLLAVGLAGLAVIGWWGAPMLVRLTAPGFLADPEKFSLTVQLTRWLFPYLWFIGLTALAGGVLNTLHRFAVPAYGPCLLNVAMIVSALVAPAFPEPVLALAAGVLVGGVLQLGVQLPLLWRLRRAEAPTASLGEAKRWGWRHPAVPQALRLLGPRALGSCVYQLNLLVDTICASWETIVGAGAVAALYYANRLFQFPLAIVGTALAQASLPMLSSQALEASRARLKGSVVSLLTLTLALAIPATVGLVLLGGTIVRVLFEHGEFSAYSTGITTQALVWYAVGLAAYMAAKILTNTCYALQDTRTPVRTAVVALGVNVVLNLALMRPMGVGGLALATSVASACNVALLWRALTRALGPLDGAAIWASTRRVLLAAAAMGAVCALGLRLGRPWLAHPAPMVSLAALAGLILLAIVVYLAAGRRLGVEALRHLPWLSTTR